MSLSMLEQRKLKLYQEKFGITNIDECLTLAIESESFAKNCGPFDPAFSKFSQDCRELQELALLLEKIK